MGCGWRGGVFVSEGDLGNLGEVDPLVWPQCGSAMKIIAFIEARQGEVIRKILEHCCLWKDPPPRGPPHAAARPTWQGPARKQAAECAVGIDPDDWNTCIARRKARRWNCRGRSDAVRFFAWRRARAGVYCARVAQGRSLGRS